MDIEVEVESFELEFKETLLVIRAVLPNHLEINPILEQMIRERGDQMSHETNAKCDMTDWAMFMPPFDQICNFSIAVAMKYSPKEFAPIIHECWGLVYREDQLTVAHDHWPAIWSFCYYINVPDDGAPIIFPDADFTFQPKNGTMVIFPGHVKHSVPPHKSKADRVAVAGNIHQLCYPSGTEVLA
ncbi:MAG: hypothetical protein HQ503_08410 [Rhodospirillales bacterium]|nr:hypothetical protein [Rhodospirillales bacterium]